MAPKRKPAAASKNASDDNDESLSAEGSDSDVGVASPATKKAKKPQVGCLTINIALNGYGFSWPSFGAVYQLAEILRTASVVFHKSHGLELLASDLKDALIDFPLYMWIAILSQMLIATVEYGLLQHGPT